mmetsp:Transcript_4752/g.17816  ORF Transcript_4752/g.17816 Transcript_4752/m.17816 type:complete len:120 (+) Transcript_4752:1935-2294(+)
MVHRDEPFSCYYLSQGFDPEKPIELLESDKPWCGVRLSYKFGTPGVGFDRVSEVLIYCDPEAEQPREFQCMPDCPNSDVITVFRFTFTVISRESCPQGMNITIPMLQQCAWYNATSGEG